MATPNAIWGSSFPLYRILLVAAHLFMHKIECCPCNNEYHVCGGKIGMPKSAPARISSRFRLHSPMLATQYPIVSISDYNKELLYCFVNLFVKCRINLAYQKQVNGGLDWG